MTAIQYAIGWTVYTVAALGSLVVLWAMTQNIRLKWRAWLRLWGAVLVLTPGVATEDGTWLSPAFLSMLYDALYHGVQQAFLNGLITVVSLAFFSVVKLLFFRQIGSAKAGAESPKSPKPVDNKRKEPILS